MNKRVIGHLFSLLHIDHVRLDDKWNYPNVISPYFRIYYIDDGAGLILSDGDKCRLEPGFIYMIPSFTLCHLRCDDYLGQYFLHFFEESATGLSLFEYNRKVTRERVRESDILNFRRLLEINRGRGINRSDNPKVYEKDAYYRDYQQLNDTVSDAACLETQGIILQLISRFMGTRHCKLGDPAPMPSKILEAIGYIQLHLHDELTVCKLAKRANLHQDYFSRLFMRFTGERPLNFIHVKRIQRAQYLIATTDLTYSQIAEETGFVNLPYFSKIFKKVTKLTPAEYKRLNGRV